MTIDSQMKQRALIRFVDDDEELLDAMQFWLTTEGWHVETYSSAKQFLDQFDATHPGCIVLDVRMPTLSGLQLQEFLNQMDNQIPILFLTGHGDMDMAIRVFRQGACDFLQKPVSSTALVEAINRAVLIDSKRRDSSKETDPRELYEQLTEREKQVVHDVAQLLSNRFIAEHLGISERTVESHRASAMKKLSCKKPAEAQVLLKKIGILD